MEGPVITGESGLKGAIPEMNETAGPFRRGEQFAINALCVAEHRFAAPDGCGVFRDVSIGIQRPRIDIDFCFLRVAFPQREYAGAGCDTSREEFASGNWRKMEWHEARMLQKNALVEG